MRRRKKQPKPVDSFAVFSRMWRRAYSETNTLPGRGISLYTGKPNKLCYDHMMAEMKRTSWVMQILDEPHFIPHKITWWDDPIYPPAEQYLTGVIKL